MENNPNDFINFSNLPLKTQEYIATYLDEPTLVFFAQSDKKRLQTVLLLLRQNQDRFPLRLMAKGNSTYLTQANQLFVCGSNRWGELGLGHDEHRLTFTAVPWPNERSKIQQVIAGANSAFLFTQTNRLWVCGCNAYGQLGLGDNEHRLTFTTVPWPADRGKILQVTAGFHHTLVLTKNNQLWVCGNNDWGQLGLKDKENRSTFTAVPWPANRGKILQVTTGSYHTLLLTEANGLWVCGENRLSQLGLGDKDNLSTFTAVSWPKERGRIQQVIAGGNYTLVLTQDNRLWGCGNNNWGQLGLGDQVNRTSFTAIPWPKERGRIQQVIAGGVHTFALTQANQLWGCGNNFYGQLGLGDKVQQATKFNMVPWPADRGRIKQIIAGEFYTVVLTDNNRLWVCGNNCNSQLGLGNKENCATFTQVTTFPQAMKQAFTFNNNLKQLIKLGTSLTLALGAKMSNLYNKRQPDEPKGQPPLKKMRL